MKTLSRSWIVALVVAYAMACYSLAETISLPAGEISMRTFAAGNVYVAHASGTTIKTTAGNPSRVVGSVVTLRGIRFIGDGVRRDGNLVGLTIEDCTFDGCRVAVEVNGGSGVTVCKSTIIRCSWSSWFSNVSSVLWENNDVTQVGYGIKLFGDSDANTGWMIRRNHFFDNGPDRMAIEIQGACRNWLVEENLVERWRYGPNKTDNDHTLLISAPMAKAAGPGMVRRNAVLGQKPRSSTGDGPWQNGAPAALEIGGTSTIVEQNLFSGAGVGITCTDKDGPASVTLKNNRIVDVFGVWNKDKDSQLVTLVGFNGDGTLDWSIDELRSKIGRNPTAPPPATQPAPPPATQPTPPPATQPAVQRIVIEGTNLKVIEQ